jgi:hypothetical protein
MKRSETDQQGHSDSGVLLAAPLAILLLVAVNALYIEGILGQRRVWPSAQEPPDKLDRNNTAGDRAGPRTHDENDQARHHAKGESAAPAGRRDGDLADRVG